MVSSIGLSNFDALGTIVGLRFKGNNRLRSSLGGFLTIFIFIVTTTTVGFFFKVYLSGSEMSQINNVVKLWDSQIIQLTDRFQVAVMTKFGTQPIEDNSIWVLEAFYFETNILENTTNHTSLSINQCTIDKWASVSYQYNLLRLDQALCIDTNGLTIKGNYNTEVFSYIKIQYNLIVDLSDPIKVAFYKTKLANEMPVSTLFFLEGSYEINGKDSVISYFVNSVNVNVTWSNIKDIEVFTSYDEINKSIDRIIYNDNTIDSIFVISQSNEKISVRPDLNTNSLSYRIMSSNKKNIIKITFMSLSEMFARIGGIVQNLLMVLFLLNYLMSYWTYDLDLLNEVTYRILNDYLLLDPRMKRSIPKNFKIQEQVQNTKRLNNLNSINFYQTKIKVHPTTLQKNTNVFTVDNKTFKLEKEGNTNNYAEVPQSQESHHSKVKLNMNDLDAKEKINVKKIKRQDNEFDSNVADQEVKSGEIASGESTPGGLSYIRSELNPWGLSTQGYLSLNESIRELFEKKKKVTFTFFSFLSLRYLEFLPSFCISKQRKHIYSYAESFLNRTLDVSNAEKNHLHLQLIKYLLLNETQLHMFENIPIHCSSQIMDKIELISGKAEFDLKAFCAPEQVAKSSNGHDKKLNGLFHLLKL